jgi:hypothetical protein
VVRETARPACDGAYSFEYQNCQAPTVVPTNASATAPTRGTVTRTSLPKAASPVTATAINATPAPVTMSRWSPVARIPARKA